MTPLAAYVLLFTAIGVGFIFVHLVAGKLLRPDKPHSEKGTIYECGEPTIGSAWVQFDLRFYVVALLFVIFDVEVAFFFPWAEVFGKANAIAATPSPKNAAEYQAFATTTLELALPTAREVDPRQLSVGKETNEMRQARVMKTLQKVTDADLAKAEELMAPANEKGRFLRMLTPSDLLILEQLDTETATKVVMAAKDGDQSKIRVELLAWAEQGKIPEYWVNQRARVKDAATKFADNLNKESMASFSTFAPAEVGEMGYIGQVMRGTALDVNKESMIHKEAKQSASTLAWMALGEILFFFGVLLVGFAYLWRRGDLTWVRSMLAERPQS